MGGSLILCSQESGAAGPAPARRPCTPPIPVLVSLRFSTELGLRQPPQCLAGESAPKKPKVALDTDRRQGLTGWVKLRTLAIDKLGKIGCDIPW